MKRGVLIGVGTLGSLGAVLSITPPQFGVDTTASGGLSGSTTPTPAPATTQAVPTPSATHSTAPAATKTATPKATKKATATPAPSKSSASSGSTAPTPTPTPTPTKTSTPTPTPTQTQAQSSGASGTFTGSTFPADEYGRNWGNVRVTVTFKNGIISSINGSQSPSSRGYMAFNQIDPYVASQKISIATIKAKSASSLPYVGGATYSSIAYWQSLKTAINQAGL